MGTQTRSANIELLRIFAIIGVIVLHYKNPTFGGGMAYVVKGSLNYHILIMLESIFVCAVDLFVLISGFFLCKSTKRSLWKPIELILQVILFGLMKYVLECIRYGGFSVKTMAARMVPANYFVILYVAVYIISPYVNLLLNNLSEKQMRRFLGICFIMFSVYPTFVDVFTTITQREWNGLSTIGLLGNQWGYTVVNFLLMYIVGAYLRLVDCKIKEWKTNKTIVMLVCCVIFMTLWVEVCQYLWNSNGSIWQYCSPFVILMAVLWFVLFLQLKIRNVFASRVINRMAEAVFSVFLLHQMFLPFIGIKRFVNADPLIMCVHIIGSAIVIYLLCWCAHVIYHIFVDPLIKRISDKNALMIVDLSGSN